MDQAEATQILAAHLAAVRQRTYQELRRLVGVPSSTVEIAGQSGTRYQVEVEVFWDSVPGANLRVLGTIDDGGGRTFVPLCADFIVVPGGAFDVGA